MNAHDLEFVPPNIAPTAIAGYEVLTMASPLGEAVVRVSGSEHGRAVIYLVSFNPFTLEVTRVAIKFADVPRFHPCEPQRMPGNVIDLAQTLVQAAQAKQNPLTRRTLR